MRHIGGLAATVALLCSCVAEVKIDGGTVTVTPEPEPEPTPEEMPVKLPLTINFSADDALGARFSEGDVVGLFVVAERDDVSEASDNMYGNVQFTLENGRWNPSEEMWLTKRKTGADIYCYSPYSGEVTTDGVLETGVRTEQNTEDGYVASFVLWGKKTGVKPSEKPVSIAMSNLMSCLNLVVKAGNGWTAKEMPAAVVHYCALAARAKVNILNGTIAADGDVEEITARNNGDGTYSAIVVPQTVKDQELVKIRFGSDEYLLKTSIDLLPGKVHTCEITVSKTNGSFNATIVGWETDNNDYGGPVD